MADDKLTGLDRWILGEFSKMEAEVIAAYEKSEFHVVYQKLSQFAGVELSSIYHDVIKDRCYTDPANSLRRRSTQTALHRLVTGLCQMLAPILAYTADEAWELISGKSVNSVHESEFKPSNLALSENEQSIWKNLFELRTLALPELEKARQAKQIGKALDAALMFVGRDSRLESTDLQWLSTLAELLNVSDLDFCFAKESEFDLKVSVSKADGQKCERCWHWEMDLGQSAEHPNLCGRCVKAVMEFQAQ